MRKIEIILVVIVLLSLAFAVCGCNEELANSPQELLIKSPAGWIEKYGDGLESQQTANIVLAIKVINRQGEAIKQLDKRLAMLENIAEPNEVKK